jgi:hypothetical protein
MPERSMEPSRRELGFDHGAHVAVVLLGFPHRAGDRSNQRSRSQSTGHWLRFRKIGCRSWRNLQGNTSSRASETAQLPTIHTPAPGPALIGMKVSVCLSHLSGGLHS